MRFCRETKGWIVAENWKNVIFGDETHIVILYIGKNKKIMFGGRTGKNTNPTVWASMAILRENL